MSPPHRRQTRCAAYTSARETARTEIVNLISLKGGYNGNNKRCLDNLKKKTEITLLIRERQQLMVIEEKKKSS